MAGELRIFSVVEVNALLPEVRAAFARVRAAGAAIESTVRRWRDQNGPDACPADLHPRPGDDAGVARFKQELRGLVARFRDAWTRVEALGAVVQDAREGLISFYGEHDGELVWLCWRVDEPEVAHWHRLDEDVRGRRPLAPQVPRLRAVH